MKNTPILFLLLLASLIFLPFSIYAEEEVAFSRDLYFGLKNQPETKHLQEFLQREGYYQGLITGDFFASTRGALIAFQEKKAVYPARGYFGPVTRALVNKMIAIRNLENQINELLALLKKLQTETSITPVEPVTTTTIPQTGTIATTTISVPVVVAPVTPLASNLSILVDYPSRSTTARMDLTVNSLKFTANEPIAIKRLILTNTGTLADIYVANIRLFDPKTNRVLATVNEPKNQTIEFVLTVDEEKTDKNLIVSGKSYDVIADIITPSRGAERPKLILDIVKASDVSAFDYNNLTRVANLKDSLFPVSGPVITF